MLQVEHGGSTICRKSPDYGNSLLYTVKLDLGESRGKCEFIGNFNPRTCSGRIRNMRSTYKIEMQTKVVILENVIHLDHIPKTGRKI